MHTYEVVNAHARKENAGQFFGFLEALDCNRNHHCICSGNRVLPYSRIPVQVSTTWSPLLSSKQERFCTLRNPLTLDPSRPPQDYWKITIDPQPNCINQGNSLLVAGIINTITDFICVMLPIRTVWHLQLKARQTFIVITLFALGFSSCIAGVVRTYYTYRVLLTWDSTWASFPVWVSSGIELYIGIVRATSSQLWFSPRK